MLSQNNSISDSEFESFKLVKIFIFCSVHYIKIWAKAVNYTHAAKLELYFQIVTLQY